MEKSLELYHEWMISFTNKRTIYIVLMGILVGVISFHCFIGICFVFKYHGSQKPWVNSMGCKNHAHGFSPLIFINIYYYYISHTKYHGCIPWFTKTIGTMDS